MTDSRTILFRAASVIDGTGRPPLPDQDVCVRGSRIEMLGPTGTNSIGCAEVIEASGCTLLPGLINMHAHLCMDGATPGEWTLAHEPTEVQLLRASRNAQVSLASGVTTIRDLGGTGRTTQILRDAIARRVVFGPRIVSCGRVITTTAGHGWHHGIRADNADELKKAARRLVEEHVDVLKVAASGGGGTRGSNVGAQQYSADELKALVTEARRLGKRVAAHAIGTASIRNAVQAGIDTIEHCGWMGEDGRLDFDESVVAMMRDQGTTVVPTLTIWYRSSYDNFENMSEDRKRMRAVREERTALWARMHAAGVRFAIGPDTGIDDTSWDNLVRELELMVTRMHVSPLEAIVAGTRHSAEGLGLEREIGQVEPGKIADLLLVRGDPATDVGALRRVVLVMRAGEPVARVGSLAAAPPSRDATPTRG